MEGLGGKREMVSMNDFWREEIDGKIERDWNKPKGWFTILQDMVFNYKIPIKAAGRGLSTKSLAAKLVDYMAVKRELWNEEVFTYKELKFLEKVTGLELLGTKEGE